MVSEENQRRLLGLWRAVSPRLSAEAVTGRRTMCEVIGRQAGGAGGSPARGGLLRDTRWGFAGTVASRGSRPGSGGAVGASPRDRHGAGRAHTGSASG